LKQDGLNMTESRSSPLPARRACVAGMLVLPWWLGGCEAPPPALPPEQAQAQASAALTDYLTRLNQADLDGLRRERLFLPEQQRRLFALRDHVRAESHALREQGLRLEPVWLQVQGLWAIAALLRVQADTGLRQVEPIYLYQYGQLGWRVIVEPIFKDAAVRSVTNRDFDAVYARFVAAWPELAASHQARLPATGAERLRGDR